MNKKMIIGLVTGVVLAVGYYLLSPLWKNIVLNEVSPLDQANIAIIKDNFGSMDEKTRMELEKQTQEMKNKVMDKTEAMPERPKVTAEGSFMARAHEVKGKALLIETDGKKILRFENFETINGPDLNIYLASELSDKVFIDLGDIRATKGNVNYKVPNGTDTTKYNKVLVWCKAFSILFSYAELK